MDPSSSRAYPPPFLSLIIEITTPVCKFTVVRTCLKLTDLENDFRIVKNLEKWFHKEIAIGEGFVENGLLQYIVFIAEWD